MWEQYRKTFLGVQVVTLAVTAWVHFKVTHNWASTGVIFLTMQVGGVLGAAWAARLRRRMQQNALSR